MKPTYNTVFRIAVCDDSEGDRREIEAMTREILDGWELHYILDAYAGGRELLNAVQRGDHYDVLLLDVMLEDIGGMAVASTLRQRGSRCQIIFISANREMAMQGYEVDALRYLSKPLDRAKLREALQACGREEMEEKEILLPTQEGHKRIRVNSIIYVEPMERGARLILQDGEVWGNIPLSSLAQELPPSQFIFCHRTILLNLAYVESVHYGEVHMKTGQSLPVSRYRQTELREKFLNYLRS